MRFYACEGPRNIRAGNKIMDFTNSSTPSTVIPINRNGSIKIHTRG